MARDENDPLRFVSYLFEIAVWPFQAASRYSASQSPLGDQGLVLIFLYPALILAFPVCLLISLVAVAYALIAAPMILILGLSPYLSRLIGPLLVLAVSLSVVFVVWGVSRGQASFSVGPSELFLACLVMVILLGHQMPRLLPTMFRNFHR